MLSFYIYENSNFKPNILVVSTIDEINKINNMIDDIIISLLENKYISLKNNLIFCIIDRKNEQKHFFVKQGSDAIKINLEKLDIDYLEKFTFNILTNYKSSYVLEYNDSESTLTLKNKQKNLGFLGNIW
tara:strand:- start:12 stop:398 length:387 start_codon:yes stop_codon:yes gene_type:complete